MADASGVSVVIDDEDELESIDPVTGALTQPQPGGGVIVDLDDHRKKPQSDENEWFRNLVDDIDGMQMGLIAGDLSDAIEADDRSRDGYLQTRAAGLGLLGLKIETPGTSLGESTTAVEGQSRVTNPLLLDAILKGWANAQAELLPAAGPLKVMAKDGMGGEEDDLAETLENDFNYYLTKTAPEYYPDTSHMLLWGTYFGGSGFKKVYRCPMRRRPVSESVDAKDLIVSDTTKDLRACERVTHYIPMRPSVMRRMQMIGAYRKVSLGQPTKETNIVDSKIDSIQGTTPTQTRPEDQPYNLWETQCELDLDEFIPKGSPFKGEGIALPYLVTLDKDSKEILAIRRDWNEDDAQCQRRRMYVKYPYVPGPGFYGTGMLQILGNASMAMTAAWREALDAGAYANFPGGLMSKLGARQNTNLFRLAPGEFVPIETGGMPISQAVMPLPYKDVTPGLLALIDKITAQAQQVGGVADIPTAEGIQNVPVGTMLAQIEQATKIMAAAHKGLHQAQGEEFSLFINLFRENPDDFWRGYDGSTPKDFWNAQKLLSALQDYNLVPQSDPNVPSHIHRLAKALALVQLAAMPIFTPLTNIKELYLRLMRILREDPEGLVIDPPAQQSMPDPKMLEAQSRVIAAQANAQVAQAKLGQVPQQMALETAKLRTEQQNAAVDLEKEKIIHQADMAKVSHEMNMSRAQHGLEAVRTVADIAQKAREHSLDAAQHGLDREQQVHDQGLGVAQHGLDVAQAGHEAGMREKEHQLAVKQANKPTPKPKGK